MHIKREMKNNKKEKNKKILFYILILLVLSWLVLSLLSIKQFIDPTQSAPWYTGIVVLTLVFSIPIILVTTLYLVINYNLNKESEEE